MAFYDYHDPDGLIREFSFPMKDAPGYQWTDDDGVLWTRLWDIPMAKIAPSAAVNHKGQDLPVSMSLPIDDRPGHVVRRGDHLLREHSDGTYCTLRGDRIIHDKNSRDRHAKLAGCVEAE